MHTLILDEMAGAEPAIRAKYRETLDHEFNAPLDPAEREQYDRDRWGLDSEAQAAATAKDAMFRDATYGE